MNRPLKYSINTINKKHLNIPRCRINPKKKDLEKLHVVPWVLLSGLKAHGPWISQPLAGPKLVLLRPVLVNFGQLYLVKPANC